MVLCLFIGIYGTCTAYEAIRRTGFGDYRSAVSYKDGRLKILDFEAEL